MVHTNFVHLHVHSHYSLLDGAATVKNLIDAAKRYKMPALAITDHGNLFGAIDFYQNAIKKGVKPILGFEAYLAANSRFDKNEKNPKDFHLVLLAQNIEGYKNLVRLSSLGYIEGFYYRPRIDKELLAKFSKGLVVLGACLQGEIPSKLLEEDYNGAKKALDFYLDVFGKDNFYLEIQNHGLEDQIKLLPKIIKFAKEHDVKLVATNDSHYVNPEDWEAHEVLLCIQTRTTLNDPNRFRFGSKEFYFKSPQEMTELFKEVPEAVTNTLYIAEKCNVVLTLDKPILPYFPIPDNKTSEQYLKELCYKALPEKYPQTNDDVIKRLEYELSIISKMGFCDYFLIVWDFIKAAKEINVPVGPGRGSAAGSLVSYLLGITDLDPLKYGLLFERFLNPDRISMPDIDIDFSDEGRGLVIDYVKKKYGEQNVSQIATFSAILAKTAIRDIGRVMGLPQAEINKIAKLVPEKPGIHLKECLEGNEGEIVPELKEIWENGTNEQKRLLKIAMTIDGLYRHSGIHAAGIVISRDPLIEIVPMFRDKSGEIVTQFEKNAIEKIGLLKMDFLGLKTLSVIQNTIENIKKNRNVTLDINKIPLDDPMTFNLLSSGKTLGVFQLESTGMRTLLTKLKPSVFEDIIALLAMYRPGPLGSGMVDDFVERKHGRAPLTYPHPDLEPILKDTYGVFLYQEQCMQTANILAGFTMAQADGLRKAMAKKIPEEMEKNGKMFVEGAVKRGIPREQAEAIFALMAKFGEYGFNKSHSAAYAVLTYKTAYLKAHYTVEFMASVLTSEVSDTDKIAEFIEDCKNFNINILPPDINKSDRSFIVENEKSIRYALAALKGVGDKAVEVILDKRNQYGPYKNLQDFLQKIDTRVVNKEVIETLIYSGALDSFGANRKQLLNQAFEYLKSSKKITSSKKNIDQPSLFDIFMPDLNFHSNIHQNSNSQYSSFVELSANSKMCNKTSYSIPDEDFTLKEKIEGEKKAFGFYFSANPYEEISPLAKLFSTHTLNNIHEGEGSICRVAGILTSIKKHVTKKGEIMAFIQIESNTSSLDVTLFPSIYKASISKLIEDKPLFLIVRPEMQGETIKVLAEQIFTIEEIENYPSIKVELVIPQNCCNKEIYSKLFQILKQNPGNLNVIIKLIINQNEKVYISPSSNLKISLTPSLIRSWEEICGNQTIYANFSNIFQNGNNKV